MDAQPVNYEFLNHFEENLQNELLKLCTGEGFLSGTLLESEDIDTKWREYAPEYMVDAVPQVAHFPTVSVAWAGYLGMAVAHWWDTDWLTAEKYKYKYYHGKNGFDDMDDHILEDVLGVKLNSTVASDLESLMRKCGELAVSLIRREEIEPQSVMAFHVFARACRVLYKIGASVELKRLGYKYEKVPLN